MLMFRGIYEFNIDSKGRTTVPLRFRELLAGTIEISQPTLFQIEEPKPMGEQLMFSFMDVFEPEKSMLAVSEERAERMMITTGLEPCLVVYTMEAWGRFETRLASLSQFDPAVVRLKRLYVAPATEVTLDKQGRLLIPANLREYAGLEHDIVWAGMVTTLELWSGKRWNEQRALALADIQSVAEALTTLGL
jgi:MraZ protein